MVHLSDDEAKRLLAGAAASRDRRFHAFVCLLHDSGARTSEILLRRGRDLDLDKGTLVAGTTKTGVPRTLFLSAATGQLMRRLWPKPDPDKLLFEGRAGGPNNFRTAWRNLITGVGLPGLRMHDMRHVAAQRLLKVASPSASRSISWGTRATSCGKDTATLKFEICKALHCRPWSRAHEAPGAHP